MAKRELLETKWRCERCGWTGAGHAFHKAWTPTPDYFDYFTSAALRHYQQVEIDGRCRAQTKRRTDMRMTHDHRGDPTGRSA